VSVTAVTTILFYIFHICDSARTYTDLTAYYTMVNKQKFGIQWISDFIWIPATNIKPM